jgi:hypothetical protein
MRKAIEIQTGEYSVQVWTPWCNGVWQSRTGMRTVSTETMNQMVGRALRENMAVRELDDDKGWLLIDKM